MSLETITQKIQPQSIEAEMSVLGAMLIDKEAIGKAVEILSEDAFYKIAHRKIYNAILDLFKRDTPVDLVTLTNELRKKRELSNIGGAIYLTTILNSVPTSANVEYYIKIVKDKYTRRQLIELGNEIVNKSFISSEDIENINIITFGQQGIDRIIHGLNYGNYTSIKELLHDVFDVIDKKYQWTRERKLVGMSTGYTDLDGKLGGLKNGNLIIIAGRPSMGKSALGLNILFNLSKAGIKTGLFSIESGKDAIINRLLAMSGKVDLMGLTTGYLEDTDFPKLITTAGKMVDNYGMMYINDTGGITMIELESTALKMIRDGVQVIMIDYLQLITGIKAENRQNEISIISARLKRLAKKLNIPLIAISQLSRAVEQRVEKKPQLSDLRESGAIEQDADVVLLLYRGEYYKPTPENEGLAEIHIAKHREGMTGVVKLAFLKQYVCFENLAKVEE